MDAPVASRTEGRAMKTVCMLVYNNFTTDARVEKEAQTLIAAGFRVRVVAVLDKTTVPAEARNGINVDRIDRRPVHYRVLWKSRAVRRWVRLSRARLRRAA